MREYKGVAILFLVVTIICSIWLISYDRCDIKSQASNDKNTIAKI